MKIWECFDNLPAQDWFYTDDKRVALTNQGKGGIYDMSKTATNDFFKGFCLDLTNGDLTNGSQAQVWKCTDNNTNQIWTTSTAAVPLPGPPMSTLVAA